MGVVLAAQNYPDTPKKGDVIHGIEAANQIGKVFHAGTAVNERGEVVFNNRYDYMRILDYFPSVNALSFDGAGIYNSPKRHSYPGRKIAVVALSQNACYAAGVGGDERLYNTGFWFPNPSTVEFTTCVTPFVRAQETEQYPGLSQDFASLASLLGVMILDVTGCTPGWKYEAETGKPFLVEIE